MSDQPVAFRTLGEVTLSRSENRALESIFVQSKQLALLSYICCEHSFTGLGRYPQGHEPFTSPCGYHRRDTLVALFWPEHDDAHAHGALRQALHGLRSALGDHTLVTRGKTEVAVNPELFWCDSCAFTGALDSGDLEDAVSIYGGAFLTGFHTPDVPEFTRWMEIARDRLERSYATALEQLADVAAQREDLLAAAEWWRRLSEHDPYNSRIVIRTMEALDTAGARGEALRLADRHETLLKRTFEAELNPEVRDTVERLRAAHTTPLMHPK
jgi:DNA-binding SARP family transcriptional activator